MDKIEIENALKGNQSKIEYDDIINTQIFLQKYGYEYKRIIGHGSFGVVMEFKRVGRNEIIAIKIISLKEEGATKTQIQEIHIIAQIKSPFVVKIKECLFDETQKLFYIISEYCSGGNLKDMIEKNSQLSLPFIMSSFSDMLNGIMDIHQKNIIHLNLKPENILFTSEGKPLLADIGLSKIKNNQFLSEEPEKVQNLLYSSQEMDDGNIAIESDYYQLGMILFLMCRPNTKSNEMLLMKNSSFPTDIQQNPNWQLLEVAVQMMNSSPKSRSPPSEVLSKLLLISDSLQFDKIFFYDLKLQNPLNSLPSLVWAPNSSSFLMKKLRVKRVRKLNQDYSTSKR